MTVLTHFVQRSASTETCHIRVVATLFRSPHTIDTSSDVLVDQLTVRPLIVSH